ncbi:MAG: PEP-CTERM sorting domain-containing protein [Chthoniobacterales bacterium]
MKANFILFLALLLTFTDASGQTYQQLDWTALGADAPTIASVDGQTFTNIGSTLGNPLYAGLTIHARWYSSLTPTPSNPGIQINGKNNLGASSALTGKEFYINHGTIEIQSSYNLGYYFSTEDGNAKIQNGETLSFAPADTGSIISYTPIAGVIVSDDSVTNPFNDAYTGTYNIQPLIWSSTPTGTGSNVFTFTVTKGGTAAVGNYGSISIFPIPEPSSGILVTLFLGGAAFYKKRQRKSLSC